MLEHLNETQKREVMRQVGNPNGISLEGLEHAVGQYLDSLRHQVEVAKAFYFGRLEEGFQGLIDLPEDVRMQIDQFIWDAAGGEAIDPTEPASQFLIAASVMHSMEWRMGMHESE